MERSSLLALAIAALALSSGAVAERFESVDSREVVQSLAVQAKGGFQRASAAGNASTENCLCSFDVDRTLTGKQDQWQECDNKEVPGVQDTAYTRRRKNMWLSELGQDIGSTFCKKCYLAIVSAGDASGRNSAERRKLVEILKASGGKVVSEAWSGPSAYANRRDNCEHFRDWQSTLVLGCSDGTKHFGVEGILGYLKSKHGVDIPKNRVYHYDDRPGNVHEFANTGMNAKQISCRYRDWGIDGGKVGLCGARPAEIQEKATGIRTCPKPVTGCNPGGPLYNAKAKDGHTCGDHIEWLKKQPNLKMTDTEARKKVAEVDEKDHCGGCGPEESDTEESTNTDGHEKPNEEEHDEIVAEGHFERNEGTKLKCSGNLEDDMREFNGPKAASREECQQWCKENPDICGCMLYKDEEKKCWLARKCEKDLWEKSPAYTLYYFVKKDGSTDGGNPNYCQWENTNAYEGFGAENIPAHPNPERKSSDDCQTWCTEVAECDCCVWQPSSNNCWLRKNCDKSKMTSNYNTGYTTYMKLRGDR